MRIRAVDGDNDWLFGKGQNDYAQANAAVVFLIGMRLRSFLADCFFDLTAGMDWFSLLGTKDTVSLDLAVRACILNTENVTGLRNILISLSPARVLTVQYEVTTVYSSAAATFTFTP